MLFSDYKNLNELTVKALNEMGITEPTDIQQATIPKIINSKDSHLLAQAKTGSGKTLAFSIPIVEEIDRELKEVQAVIMTPTRELCQQIYDVVRDLTKYNEVYVVSVYGGVSLNPQIDHIRNGAQIIVATPGRLIDLYKRGAVKFNNVKFVVLDEADRMLDMGFFPDIEYLLLTAMHGVKPRMLCYSATMLQEIQDLGRKFTSGKNVIKVNLSEDDLTVSDCKQYYYMIDEFRDKIYHFIRILKQEKPEHSIIFVNTKKTGEWLSKRLSEKNNLGLKIDVIMGSLSQKQRDKVLNKFKTQQINCLIATDVAARGLDIPDVSHVFNYDIPEYTEVYVHRIGRTARISTEKGDVEPGVAISLVLKDQYNLLARIEGDQDKDIKRRPLPPRSSKKGGRKSHSNRGPQEYREHRKPKRKQTRRGFLY